MARYFSFNRKAVIAGVTAVAVVGVAGTAYAFVVASGHSNDKTVTTTVDTLAIANGDITVTLPTAGTIQPGGTFTYSVTVHNSRAFKSQINTVLVNLPRPTAVGNTVTTDAFGTLTLNQPTVAATVLAKDDGALGGADEATFTGSIVVTDSALIDQTSLLNATLTATAYINTPIPTA